MKNLEVHIYRLIAFVIILFFSNSLNSQRYDFNWLMGYTLSTSPSEGITSFNFNSTNGNPIIFKDPGIKIDLYYYGSMISDKKGNFNFVFNGYEIEDFTNTVVPNSRKQLCPDNRCEFVPQGSIILPNLYNDSSYFLFHEIDSVVYLNDSEATIVISRFVINELAGINNQNAFSLNPKSQNLINGIIDNGKVAACKHANGRDWWILVPGSDNHSMHTLLLDNIGVREVFVQKLSSYRHYGGGYAKFSSNGEFYCISSLRGDSIFEGHAHDLFHFDRCSGILSNQQHIDMDSDKEQAYTGCAFSPDNSKLYVVDNYTLLQYSIDSVGMLNNNPWKEEYDGFLSTLFSNVHSPTVFGALQNAPDGKIYMNSNLIQSKHIHVIHNPNEKGAECNFRQHDLNLPTVVTTMPYFPNYRLGPIDGSSCDTLGIDNIPWCWWRYDQDSLDYLKFKFTELTAYEVESWNWDFGDGHTSIEKLPLYRFEKNGKYRVCLIASNNNGSDTLCRDIQVGTTAHENLDDTGIQFHIFPNPSKDVCIVNVYDYNPENMQMIIYDNAGKSVGLFYLRQGSNSIPVHHLINGLYHIQITKRGKQVYSQNICKWD